MITVNSLHKYYNKGKANEFHAIKGVNLQIAKGELLAMVGDSGSGKSTLLNILGCIDSFDEGEIKFDEKSISKLKDAELAKIRNKYVGIILQDYALIPDYTVIENVMVPLYFTNLKKRKEIAIDALMRIGVTDLMNKNVNQLSGGQKQQVAIARAIVNNPPYILADEPTGAIDSKTSKQILDIICEINYSGTTIIIATHDKAISSLCNRIITIQDGMIV